MQGSGSKWLITIAGALAVGALLRCSFSAKDALPIHEQAPMTANAEDARPSLSPGFAGGEALAAPSPRASGKNRPFIAPNPPRDPVGNASLAIAGLRSLASAGDAAANFSLYRILARCHYLRLGESTDASLDCSTVSAENIASRLDYLTAAAAAGDPNAQIEFPVAASSRFVDADRNPDGQKIAENLEAYLEYRRQAMAFLHAGALSGNVRAMNAVAEAYSRGLLVDKDPTAAYAYALAAERTGLSPGHAPWVRGLQARLTPEERARGDQWARQILHACCG